MAFKQVGVLEPIYERLTQLKLNISAEKGEQLSYSDIIDFLIKKYEEKFTNEVDPAQTKAISMT